MIVTSHIEIIPFEPFYGDCQCTPRVCSPSNNAAAAGNGIVTTQVVNECPRDPNSVYEQV